MNTQRCEQLLLLMHGNAFTPAEGQGTQRLLRASPSLHRSSPDASSQHQSLVTKAPQGHSSASQGCPATASFAGWAAKKYQTSRNKVGTTKHFADGKYVLHWFRKGNEG